MKVVMNKIDLVLWSGGDYPHSIAHARAPIVPLLSCHTHVP